MPAGRCCAALALAVSLALPARSDPAACPDGSFRVETGSAALAAEVCALAPRIRDDLEACGLTQSRPLSVEIVEGLSHPLGTCLAWYDCDLDLIRLTDPASYGAVLEASHPYAALPAPVLFRAVLTHEMTHALLTQGAGGRAIAPVDQEYVAAAMELDLMEPEWREVLLEAAPVELPPRAGLIDIWIYRLEPRKFATNAWQHFSLPQNGCGLVRRIAAGEVSLGRKR